ncbi:metallophosphoesterase family protein [Betaproteobacteria bacterium SCN1]|nr:metallophosphoesterase family protein [Betaproteobacteria bacterium SCN1]ODU87502.1 MAG: YfcE family phosphodiesterase [Thiobacillus sp. SCN 65-179]OJW38749.1 MAG: YfcE family phosphodiesterase [Thiobacillus sp. 65-69]
MKIGLISDTHGLLRPEALAALAGCEHLIHAGDIGSRSDRHNGVLDTLANIAPLTVVRGNNDRAGWAAAIPHTADLEFGGVRIHVLHILGELAIDPAAAGVQVVVSGHSHKPCMETRRGVLYVNPGSAGPRRFRLPVTVARLTVACGRVDAELVTLLE